MKTEVYKEVDDFLVSIKDSSGSLAGYFLTDLGTNAILLMKKYKLVHFKSANERASIIVITLEGSECINKGGIANYIAFLELKNTHSAVPNVHIGHNIHAPVSQSDLSTSAFNRPITQPISTQTKPSFIFFIFKWILKNIIQIIITVIAAGIAYYLGFTKSH